jgi:glucose-6-phosphate isomerase
VQGCLEATIGSLGLKQASLDDNLNALETALSALREAHAKGTLPMLRVPEWRDDIAAASAALRKLSQDARKLIFFGTGGSSLGGQTLAQLAGHAVPGVGALRDGPRLHFMDNLDPDSFALLLARAPLATTRFVAISKSGGTGETLMQTIAALDAVRAAGLAAKIGQNFLGVSEPLAGKRNGLRELIKPDGVPVLDHDPNIGGRYSVLTNVGLLPAAVAGLDIAAVRAGAAAALAPVLAGRPPAEVPACVGAALSVTLAQTRGKAIAVLMAYADRLERMTHWDVQLWAESLGKDGKGTTPIGALGPVDQHSQLQLYIAGPRDKLFTVVTVGAAGRGPRMDKKLAALAGEADFAGKTMGDLVAAQGRATAETLVKNGCPVRTIHLERLDEASLGELLMHFMLETIIAAHLFGVDPFDQPAVEEGKVLAKKYLAGGA